LEGTIFAIGTVGQQEGREALEIQKNMLPEWVDVSGERRAWVAASFKERAG
jgi:hypothetical protein